MGVRASPPLSSILFLPAFSSPHPQLESQSMVLGSSQLSVKISAHSQLSVIELKPRLRFENGS